MNRSEDKFHFAPFAISPLDGRYLAEVEPIQRYFSEFALMKERSLVEILYLKELLEGPLSYKMIKTTAIDEVIDYLLNSFSLTDFYTIKSYEKETNHDVKAVEYFLREFFVNNSDIQKIIHFALTSEDINNLAYSRCLKSFIQQDYLPLLKHLISDLCSIADQWQDIPFPARTHGQLASPTTAGKEISVFISRLTLQWKKIEHYLQREICGKLNGATGNFAAHMVALPLIDWQDFSTRFIQKLGLQPNIITTQIEDHDHLAYFFNLCRAVNSILIDLDKDFWLYISYGYFQQKTKASEVGSSTMPHKINPINFENSEGNLLFANAILSFLSDKLVRSRMQRDLSDSTVLRNIGVPLAHSYLGVTQIQKGLKNISCNQELCLAEINNHPELLGEAIQTVSRIYCEKDAYDQVKEITRPHRGQTSEQIRSRLIDFINTLPLDHPITERLQQLKISDYLGLAETLCSLTIQSTKKDLQL